MGKVIATLGATVIKSLLTEKVIKAILIKLGDYFIAKSDNKLDDTLWAEVKKALG